MTIKELKEKLEDYSEDTEVFFAHPSGDYWDTELATPVDDTEQAMINYSEYHRQYQTNSKEENKPKDVLILIGGD